MDDLVTMLAVGMVVVLLLLAASVGMDSVTTVEAQFRMLGL